MDSCEIYVWKQITLSFILKAFNAEEDNVVDIDDDVNVYFFNVMQALDSYRWNWCSQAPAKEESIDRLSGINVMAKAQYNFHFHFYFVT